MEVSSESEWKRLASLSGSAFSVLLIRKYSQVFYFREPDAKFNENKALVK